MAARTSRRPAAAAAPPDGPEGATAVHREDTAGAASALPRALDVSGPKGGQLRAILQDLIATLAPGDPLPSERALAERYGVARGTVRAEIDRLVTSGAAERVHGRGTFVAQPRVEQAARYSSFTEDMRARGLVPGSAVLRQEEVAAPPEIARTLGLEHGAEVVRLERLRTADGRPMALEEVWLPADRFAALVDADLASGSLVALLERDWGVRVFAARQRAVAVVVDAQEARLLGVEPGSPALRFTTLADDGAALVYHATSLFRADRYEIDLHQRR